MFMLLNLKHNDNVCMMKSDDLQICFESSNLCTIQDIICVFGALAKISIMGTSKALRSGNRNHLLLLDQRLDGLVIGALEAGYLGCSTGTFECT